MLLKNNKKGKEVFPLIANKKEKKSLENRKKRSKNLYEN